jgi:NTE family protein
LRKWGIKEDGRLETEVKSWKTGDRSQKTGEVKHVFNPKMSPVFGLPSPVFRLRSSVSPKNQVLDFIQAMHYKSILILLFGFTVLQLSNAQQKPTRPKIGLTLSGGGAKGLAHIGILQAIDKAGLKVDYITGTSMGSIVGGLYAAGYSGDRIEHIARGLDWEEMFSTAPQISQIRIEEKSEFDKYALEIPFENRKFKIAQGFIDGQELWLKLSELFEPVYNINDFSKLSIPFKCIGTDLETGNVVVMDHGNIVTAIRASMAIPSVFTPVKYDGKLLADGGIVNNFPILEVKQMGADYVIGVNLNHGLSKAEDLESALDILYQIGFFKDAATFEKHKEQCNLFILPELKDYSASSFAAADSIIDIGIETGRQYYPIFKKLADSLDLIYGKSDFEKDRLPENKHIKISKYSAEGFKNTEEKFFFGLLNLQDNKGYSYKEMHEAIQRVYGSRFYRIIRYDFLPDSDGSTEMHFSVEENPLTNVKLALNYNSFAQVGLIFNVTSRDLLLKESRALMSASVSKDPQVYAEYYKHINKNRTARAVIDFYYQAVDFPVYDDFRLNETLRSYYSVYDFQIQQNINLFSYFGAGQQYNNSKIKTKESPNLIYNGNNNYWYSYLSYHINNTNKKYFTTRGWNVKAKTGYVYGQDVEYEYSINDSTVYSDSLSVNNTNYFKVIINATHYSEINTKFSWSQNLKLAFINSDYPFIADKFVVGGMDDNLLNQLPFAGLNVGEIKTGSIASLVFGLQYRMTKRTYLTGRVNAALYNFYGTGWDKLTSNNNLLTGYGLTFGYDSGLGPIELTLMYCDQDGSLRNYINIGYVF